MENVDAEISMEFHGNWCLMFSMEFHGKCPNPPCKYFPWKSMEKFPWNSMEIDVLILHGIPWRIFHGNPWNSMDVFHTGSCGKIMQHLESCLLWQLKLTDIWVNLWCFKLSFSSGCTKWNTAAIKSLLLFMAGLFTGFLVEESWPGV